MSSTVRQIRSILLGTLSTIPARFLYHSLPFLTPLLLLRPHFYLWSNMALPWFTRDLDLFDFY